MNYKKIKIEENVFIPVLGFGTWKLTGKDCVDGVRSALEIGYRHIDTADVYGNHQQVAEGIKQGGIKREDFFLTSKIFYNDLSPEKVLRNCDRFLNELETNYLDLLLIHWPNKKIPIEETLQAMNELKKTGKIKSFGVSNFTIHHLSDILEKGFKVSLNQVELHPTFNQKELRAFCNKNNIAVTAYSPLGRGEDLSLPEVEEISKKYSCASAQVILSWLINRNVIVIPKSKNKERIEENFKALSLDLKEEDLLKLDNLPQKQRILNPPFNEFDY